MAVSCSSTGTVQACTVEVEVSDAACEGLTQSTKLLKIEQEGRGP